MARRKTTVTIDEDLLRLAKVAAARAGKREYEVFEDALRRHLSLDVLDRVWARNESSSTSEEEALALAREALAAVRARRKASLAGPA